MNNDKLKQRIQIGDHIRTARESADMTQAELAKAVGTTQVMISRYESGEQEPTVSRLIAIAKALKIRPSNLLEDITMSETKLTVNGAWTVTALPDQYVVELADGRLAKLYIAPFRQVSESDLTPYAGYHPGKIGLPMSDCLYRFYGLQTAAQANETAMNKQQTASEPLDIFE
jgi:transcriptional regulator with XRE-family HTH domain